LAAAPLFGGDRGAGCGQRPELARLAEAIERHRALAISCRAVTRRP